MAQNQRRLEELKNQMIQFYPDLRQRMDSQIEDENLYRILSEMNRQLGGIDYDGETFEELVEKTKEEQNFLSPQGFLNTYLQAEEILTLKKEHMQSSSNKYQQNSNYISDLVQELNQRQHGQQNYGQGNNLILDKIRVFDLQSPTNQNPNSYLVFELGNFKQQTNVQFSNSPVFEIQGLEIPVYSFQDVFSISVFDRSNDYSGQNFLYGTVELKVDSLPFFNNQNVTYKLMKQGTQVHTELELSCHIQVNDCNRAINDLQVRRQFFQEKIDGYVEEIKALEEQIGLLSFPFQRSNNLISNLPNNIDLYDNQPQNQYQQERQSYRPFEHDNQQSNYNPNRNIPQNNEYQQQFNPPPNNIYQENHDLTNKSLASEQNFGQMKPFQQQPMEQMSYQQEPMKQQQQPMQAAPTPTPGPQNYQPPPSQKMYDDDDELQCDCAEYIKRSDLVTLVFLVIAILQCLMRPQFVDIFIGTSFLVFLYKRRFQNQNYQELLKIFLGAIAFSMILDLIWFLKYVGGWGSDQTSVDQGQEGVLRGFTIFFAFLGFFFKFIVGGSYNNLRGSDFESLRVLEGQFSDSLKDTYRKNDVSQNLGYSQNNYQDQQQQQQQQHQQQQYQDQPVGGFQRFEDEY